MKIYRAHKYLSIKIGTVAIFSYSNAGQSFWVRIFRYGISITTLKRCPRFSYRYNYTKALKIGPYFIKLLKPCKSLTT